MKILVTGGAGFIGSHLSEALLEKGEEVWVIDDLSTGKLENLEKIVKHPRFHLVVDTIMNEKVMEELIEKVDQIYHLAAAVGVRLIMDRPIETIETNVRGTEIVLKIANLYKRKVLLASTSEIYGNHVEHTLSEDDNRILGSVRKRRWAYASSKTVDEFLALAYHLEKKLPVVIARIFNTVGPRQTGQYGMVIPNFVQAALLGKPIQVYGDGKQSRSFNHVKDTISALIGLMNEPAAEGDVFNVGNGEEITIADLAEKIKKMTGSPSPIEFVPYEEAYGYGFEDMQRRTPNISKIRSLIGYTPSRHLEETLQSVIDYFKQ
ncbi:MAG: GDP-mannose 4,6-dehydratase [Candidatus Omnitrophica bacterium]|nr:GDP-mannose 4,6-dehydratase [Candidatus Omnitrophota bacterium]